MRLEEVVFHLLDPGKRISNLSEDFRSFLENYFPLDALGEGSDLLRDMPLPAANIDQQHGFVGGLNFAQLGGKGEDPDCPCGGFALRGHAEVEGAEAIGALAEIFPDGLIACFVGEAVGIDYLRIGRLEAILAEEFVHFTVGRGKLVVPTSGLARYY